MVGVIAKSQFSSPPRFYSGIEGVEAAKVIGSTFVPDKSNPSTVFLLPDPGHARLVFTMEVAVLAIFLWRDDAKIRYPVICPVMRDVVDFPVWHLSVHEEPSKAMRPITYPEDGDTEIPVAERSCDFASKARVPDFVGPRTNRHGIVGTLLPCKDSSFGVIVQDALEFVLCQFTIDAGGTKAQNVRTAKGD